MKKSKTTLTMIAVGMLALAGCSKQEKVSGPEARLVGVSQQALATGRHFFYVHIPGKIGPEDRVARFENPLRTALDKAGLGLVSGGGSQFGQDKAIVSSGLDVIVTKHDEGLALIRKVLIEGKAPEGTLIKEYLPKAKEWGLK
jgi:hypothetical protein